LFCSFVNLPAAALGQAQRIIRFGPLSKPTDSRAADEHVAVQQTPFGTIESNGFCDSLPAQGKFRHIPPGAPAAERSRQGISQLFGCGTASDIDKT